MWVKEVIVDGFKSYANRTVISGWDQSFNAITGLNGTGKSNILDSICFVLGISQLSQVRVNNLQELVYKQGQARVTKASVTIVFDNRDTKKSPVGYEQYEEITVTRQIVIGGRNKYLINGVTAQLSRVQNLFHSVQLNVNNPHFLIMQGRITKVINMKPPEILSMIEEAAGTRMYETKKLAAQKTIAKKQSKVEEINNILTDEITPTLEKLRSERSSFMKWSANNTELERLSRFLVAADFLEAKELVDCSEDQVQGMEQKKQTLEERCEVHTEEVKEAQQQIDALNDQKNTEMKAEFKELEKGVTDCSKELVKHTAIWQNALTSLEAEKKNKASEAKIIVDLNKNIAKKEKECSDLETKAKEVQQAHIKLEQHISSLQESLLGIGMSSNKEEEQGSLAAQLMEAQKHVTQLEAESKAAATKVTHIKKQVNDKRKKAKSAEKEYHTMKKTLDTKTSKRDQLQAKLAALGFNDEEKATSEKLLRTAMTDVKKLREEVDHLRSRMPHMCNFNYKSSSKLNEKTVKGLLLKLLELTDEKNATALEVTAGGKLFNVVVDNEKTGKELMEKGDLKKRVTIIPLNKIARKSIAPQVVQTAENLVGKENVQPAISLVGYEHEVEAAMMYVFGDTFVCKNAKTAEQVTFNNAIKKKSVTLTGDVFDPRGTLSGGSAPKGGSILMNLQGINTAENALAVQTKKYTELRKKVDDMSRAEEAQSEMSSQLELLNHELGLLTQRVESTSFAREQAEVEELEKEVGLLEERAKEAKKEQKEEQKRAKDLEDSIKDFEKERKNKQKEIEKEAKEGKKKIAESAKGVKAAESVLEQCKLELADMVSEQETLTQQQGTLEKNLEEAQARGEELEQTVAEKKEVYDAANDKLSAEKERIAETDKQINAIHKKKSKVDKQLKDIELEMKKLAHKISRLTSERADAEKQVSVLMKKHSWIATEMQFFGKEKTDYDFKAVAPKGARVRLNELKTEQEDLSKRINKKVMGMFEKAEQEYQELMKKRDIIEKDKTKIEEVITELDQKKNEALETTWKKVNKDFGSIFSALLPGTDAKLEPPEGCSVLDGLEVRVAFGAVWKDSLTELSGGQRSLLALSLILALLLFKPAPFYILDEIDAALDLSHTQNIGQMLKTHFKQSQFIVVSLKEGMFQNANVIFRTKFVDGVSAVARTVNRVN